MPTANRREWITAAVECFLRQTHTDSELIVLDSGEHAVEYLLPSSPRIRYIRDSPDHTLGVLCNHATVAARGEWIAVWDDDDWYWPGRLDEQLRAIGSAKVCGYDRIYFEPKKIIECACFTPGRTEVEHRNVIFSVGEAMEYHAPAGHLLGNSLFFRRDFWERTQFRAMSVGYDGAFVQAARGRIVALDGRGKCIASIHAGNTSPRNTSGPEWRRVDPRHLLT